MYNEHSTIIIYPYNAHRTHISNDMYTEYSITYIRTKHAYNMYSTHIIDIPSKRLRLNHNEVVRRMQLVKNTAFGLARVQNLSTFTVCMHPPREIFSFYFFYFIFLLPKKSTRLSVLSVCVCATMLLRCLTQCTCHQGRCHT